MTKLKTSNERTKQRKERRRRQREKEGQRIIFVSAPTGGWRSNRERRAFKFQSQGGICHWFTEAKRLGVPPKCPVKGGYMTLEHLPDNKLPPNFATFEHLVRRREGGLGKPFNTVLACDKCNRSREKGYRPQIFQPRKPENIAAEQIGNAELLRGAKEGTLNNAEISQLFTRKLVPNWPMWFRVMADVPPPF